MIAADDYHFSDSDTPVFYETDQSGNQSLKLLTTRNKFIEFDVPNLPGQAYEVILRVQNHVGTTHRDTLIITVEQPLVVETGNEFLGENNISGSTSVIDESTGLREPLTETVIYDELLTIQATNKKDMNPMQVSLSLIHI